MPRYYYAICILYILFYLLFYSLYLGVDLHEVFGGTTKGVAVRGTTNSERLKEKVPSYCRVYSTEHADGCRYTYCQATLLPSDSSMLSLLHVILYNVILYHRL